MGVVVRERVMITTSRINRHHIPEGDIRIIINNLFTFTIHPLSRLWMVHHHHMDSQRPPSIYTLASKISETLSNLKEGALNEHTTLHPFNTDLNHPQVSLHNPCHHHHIPLLKCLSGKGIEGSVFGEGGGASQYDDTLIPLLTRL